MSSISGWIIILLIYAYIASILPVTLLLQPRDYINAFQLIIAMSLLIAGICIARPVMVAPVYQANPSGAPPLFPLLRRLHETEHLCAHLKDDILILFPSLSFHQIRQLQRYEPRHGQAVSTARSEF